MFAYLERDWSGECVCARMYICAYTQLTNKPTQIIIIKKEIRLIELIINREQWMKLFLTTTTYILKRLYIYILTWWDYNK